MSDLSTQPAELNFTVSITRKATGKVEEYQLVGHVLPDTEQPETPQPEPKE